MLLCATKSGSNRGKTVDKCDDIQSVYAPTVAGLNNKQILYRGNINDDAQQLHSLPEKIAKLRQFIIFRKQYEGDAHHTFNLFNKIQINVLKGSI